MRPKKRYEELKQPRIKRPQPFEAPLRIHLNPSRWAEIGGLLSATIALFFYLIRDGEASLAHLLDSLVWLGLTYVVGYALTGGFMLYILWVREHELEPSPVPEPVVVEEDLPLPEDAVEQATA
jgi:hypothetical protein